MYVCISAQYGLNLPSCMYVSILYIVSIYRHVCMYESVLYIVSMSRHVFVYVCVYVGVTYMHAYVHTHMIYFLFIMLCKCLNKLYIKSHDMRKKYSVGKGRRSRQRENKKREKR